MSYDAAPLSKTAKYKKITKPLLERKRRARINRCLDELKDLMVGALEIDDDNLSKLEKADILELTVNHLTKLHSPKDPVGEAKKFQAGFGQCAAEACRFIMSVPDLDENVSQNLISHLSRLVSTQPLTIQVPERPSFSPPTSPSSMISDRQHYYSDQDRSSSDAEDSTYTVESAPKRWASNYSSRVSQKHSGLLTTVDKVPVPHYQEQPPVRHNYFNRVPAEAKDVILQKIRQHIMDKRGNDNVNLNVNTSPEGPVEPKYLHTEDAYTEHSQYSIGYSNNSETLDLRKVRSPTKVGRPAISPEVVAGRSANQLDSPPVAENKAEVTASVPEQCESPQDYSNLPPKKKRKLIEYQEYKKQEEARRQLDAFYAQKKEAERQSVDCDTDMNKWRPW